MRQRVGVKGFEHAEERVMETECACGQHEAEEKLCVRVEVAICGCKTNDR